MSLNLTFTPSPMLSRDLAELSLPLMARLALKVETEAKRRVPVKTGNLRRSITSTAAMTGGIPTGVVAATAHYGGFVEIGTVFMQPQPYLRPALISVINARVA